VGTLTDTDLNLAGSAMLFVLSSVIVITHIWDSIVINQALQEIFF
jgi:hypothetical protein